jgi:hypothetical protein
MGSHVPDHDPSRRRFQDGFQNPAKGLVVGVPHRAALLLAKKPPRRSASKSVLFSGPPTTAKQMWSRPSRPDARNIPDPAIRDEWRIV